VLEPVKSFPLDKLATGARHAEAARLRTLAPATRLAFRSREAGIGPAGDAYGVALPVEPCRFNIRDNRLALWLGPDEWLLIAPNAEPAPIFATIEAALAGIPHALVDVSSRSIGIEIAGEQAAFVLNQGCPLDLHLQAFPVGMCTRTLFAKTEIVLVRHAPDVFHIDVWRSFAAYLWTYLDEARRELA